MNNDMDTATARPWWKDAVVYQIYPRSFADSNGGIGADHRVACSSSAGADHLVTTRGSS